MSLELEIRNVSFRYTGLAASDEDVLKQVTIVFNRCECAAIVGPSGSGKTTLIQHFTGLLKPISGQVLVDGMDLAGKKSALVDVRQKIGLVFQFPEAQLFEETVAKDVAYGPGNLGLAAEEIQQRVAQALELVDLQPQEFSERSPFRLSEGEKRRTAIAGVLAMQPALVVLDEPTAGLDPKGVRCIIDLIGKLIDQGTAVIVVTHHMDLVAEVAGRVVVMLAGAVIFDGLAEELFQQKEILTKADLQLPDFISSLRALGSVVPPAWHDAISYRQLLRMISS